MKTETAVKKVAEFLQGNPGATRAAIGKATKLKAIELTNALRRLRKEKQLIEETKDDDVAFSLVASPVLKPSSELEIPVDDEQLPKKKGRDNTKYSYGGNTYGKARLCQEIVKAYVAGHKGTTYAKLKQAFPDELLQRFGIFRTEDEARKLSSAGRDRFFLGEEDGIKLKDCTVFTCNQFTAVNIQPFLKQAKSLGFKIK